MTVSADIAAYYWDAVEAGDPTPPPEEHPDGLCWTASPKRPFLKSYACGRPKGHAGQHVAPTDRQIMACWPQEASP